MKIRIATTHDHEAIRRLYLSAFPEKENQLVATLAVALLSEQAALPILSLIAEIDGAVIGHVAFSPVAADLDSHLQAYILAPLAVKPEHQNQRIGTALVEYGLQTLIAQGGDIIFVYGAPEYYGRFGFNADAAYNYHVPYPLQYPFGWQAIAIGDGVIKHTAHSLHCVKALCNPLLW